MPTYITRLCSRESKPSDLLLVQLEKPAGFQFPAGQFAGLGLIEGPVLNLEETFRTFSFVISVVANRYLQNHGRRDLEIWKPVRQIREVACGQTLRVQAPTAFRLHWTTNEWRTLRDTTSVTTRLGVEFVDIPIDADQRAPIRFTFFWTASEKREGRDDALGVRVQRD